MYFSGTIIALNIGRNDNLHAPRTGHRLQSNTNTLLIRKGRIIMALMTGEQYVESMRKLNLQVYMFGEKIENPVDDPILRPSLNSVKMTYDLAQMPEYEDLMTSTSNLTGEKINRFTNIHMNAQDLVKKVKMQRLCGQKTRCV